jgi:hypothetical protein
MSMEHLIAITAFVVLFGAAGYFCGNDRSVDCGPGTTTSIIECPLLSRAKVNTLNAARRIAMNIARLPELLGER